MYIYKYIYKFLEDKNAINSISQILVATSTQNNKINTYIHFYFGKKETAIIV